MEGTMTLQIPLERGAKLTLTVAKAAIKTALDKGAPPTAEIYLGHDTCSGAPCVRIMWAA